MNRTIVAGGAGGGIGAVIAWYWNATNPDMQMDASVAAALAGLLGPFVAGLGQVITALLGRLVDRIEPSAEPDRAPVED